MPKSRSEARLSRVAVGAVAVGAAADGGGGVPPRRLEPGVGRGGGERVAAERVGRVVAGGAARLGRVGHGLSSR
jgi:hypothetical protein